MEMGFFEHLEELRMRILLSVLAIIVCSILGFVYAREIIAFLMVPLRQAMSGMPLPAQLHYTSLTEPLFQSFKIALFAGLMLAFPYWIWQLWRFVAPGLLDKEKKLAGPILLSATGLFIAGVSFAYIIAVPTAYRFLLMYASAPTKQKKIQAGKEGLIVNWVPQQQKKRASIDPKKLHLQLISKDTKQGKRWKLHLKTSQHKTPQALFRALLKKKKLDVLLQDNGKKQLVQIQYQWNLPSSKNNTLTPILTLKAYLSVSTWFLFGFGIVFQTPMAIFLLSIIGIVRPETLGKYRRHAFVAILIIASILTPTGDPVNLMIMAIPMYILFEIGMLVSKLFLRSRRDDDDDDDDSPPPPPTPGGGSGGKQPPGTAGITDDEEFPEDTWAAYQQAIHADLEEDSEEIATSEADTSGDHTDASLEPPAEILAHLEENPVADDVAEAFQNALEDARRVSAPEMAARLFGSAAIEFPEHEEKDQPIAETQGDEVEEADSELSETTSVQEPFVDTVSDEPEFDEVPEEYEDAGLEYVDEETTVGDEESDEYDEEDEDEAELPPSLRGWDHSIGSRPTIKPPQQEIVAFVPDDEDEDSDAAAVPDAAQTSDEQGTSVPKENESPASGAEEDRDLREKTENSTEMARSSSTEPSLSATTSSVDEETPKADKPDTSES